MFDVRVIWWKWNGLRGAGGDVGEGSDPGAADLRFP